MSKSVALQMLSGEELTANPSLVTPDVPVGEAAPLEAPVKSELQSDRLAIFAKKEQQLMREREALKKERDELAKEKADAESTRKRAKEFDDLSQKDKLAALKLIGWSDTDIINALTEISEGKPEPTAEEKARLIAQEETQKMRNELKAEKEQAEREQNDRLIKNLKSDISSKIKSESEKYEYCSFEGAEAETQVYEIIVENLKENNELLSVDEALEIAEQYYEERDKAMAVLKKRQPKVEVPEPAPAEAKPPAQAAQKPKTLTNKITASTSAALSKKETAAEKRERLMAALKRGSL